MSSFVDRERELDMLMKLAMGRKKVLIKGRRGIGKSLLAMKVLEELKKKGIRVLYINCLTVTTGRDLLRRLSSVYNINLNYNIDNKSALDEFFRLIDKHDISVVVFDEITNLFYVLGRKKEFGNISNFANIFRGYVVDLKAAVIATTSSMAELRKIIRKSRILGRTFNFIMPLEPFTREHAIELAKLVATEVGRDLPEEDAERIAILADFVPFYIEALTRAYMLYGDINRALQVEFTSGTLAEYFSSLFEDLSPTQRSIILRLGTGRKKYEELEGLVGEDISQALSELIDRDLVVRIYITRKNVFYATKDRTFASWVVFFYHSTAIKRMEEILQMTTLSFEAFVRETLGALQSRIRIRDSLGRELELGPFTNVTMHKYRYGQIDVFATDFDGNLLLGECYMGSQLTIEKIRQLEKHKKTFPKAILIVFTTAEIPDKTKKYAEEKNIYIIGIESLKEIRKNTPMHPF